MNVPNKIKVGGYTYSVVFVEDLRNERDVKLLGQVLYAPTKRISLHEDCKEDPKLLLDTLLHEILHSLYHHFDLAEQEEEEKVITTIATGLVMVYVDNPELVDLIKKATK